MGKLFEENLLLQLTYVRGVAKHCSRVKIAKLLHAMGAGVLCKRFKI
jgi:hypothetical protein